MKLLKINTLIVFFLLEMINPFQILSGIYDEVVLENITFEQINDHNFSVNSFPKGNLTCISFPPDAQSCHSGECNIFGGYTIWRINTFYADSDKDGSTHSHNHYMISEKIDLNFSDIHYFTLHRSDFTDVYWMKAEDEGFYQPGDNFHVSLFPGENESAWGFPVNPYGKLIIVYDACYSGRFIENGTAGFSGDDNDGWNIDKIHNETNWEWTPITAWGFAVNPYGKYYGWKKNDLNFSAGHALEGRHRRFHSNIGGSTYGYGEIVMNEGWNMVSFPPDAQSCHSGECNIFGGYTIWRINTFYADSDKDGSTHSHNHYMISEKIDLNFSDIHYFTLHRSDFTDVYWMKAEDEGFYQPGDNFHVSLFPGENESAWGFPVNPYGKLIIVYDACYSGRFIENGTAGFSGDDNDGWNIDKIHNETNWEWTPITGYAYQYRFGTGDCNDNSVQSKNDAGNGYWMKAEDDQINLIAGKNGRWSSDACHSEFFFERIAADVTSIGSPPPADVTSIGSPPPPLPPEYWFTSTPPLPPELLLEILI